MSILELIPWIRAGVNRNIMVFDSEAKDGELSIRLLNLMKEVALYNGIILYDIVIPQGTTAKDVDQFYKLDEKGSMPSGKEHVIIGMGPLYGNKYGTEKQGQDSRHVLLGAY